MGSIGNRALWPKSSTLSTGRPKPSESEAPWVSVASPENGWGDTPPQPPTGRTGRSGGR